MGKIDSMVNTVIQGDCLPVLKNMPDNSVDLLLTDPQPLEIKDMRLILVIFSVAQAVTQNGIYKIISLDV